MPKALDDEFEVDDETTRLHARLARAEEQVARLQAELDALRAAGAHPRVAPLPVLCRDLARWSALPATAAAPPGPPPLPPTAADLDAFTLLATIFRRLLNTPTAHGQPFHSAFDSARYKTFLARYRETTLLAEKLFGQVERSGTQRDLAWHLMVARRVDEVNRKRR